MLCFNIHLFIFLSPSLSKKNTSKALGKAIFKNIIHFLINNNLDV